MADQVRRSRVIRTAHEVGRAGFVAGRIQAHTDKAIAEAVSAIYEGWLTDLLAVIDHALEDGFVPSIDDVEAIERATRDGGDALEGVPAYLQDPSTNADTQ